MSRPHTPIDVRFWPKVRKTATCWLWTGALDRRGYGVIGIGKRRGNTYLLARTHRVAWELTHGPIPDGLCLCHRCDVPRCVNPDHLFLGTQSDNMADAKQKGRVRAPTGDANRAKTHCPAGHPYDAVNTYRPPSRPNERQCWTCLRAQRPICEQRRTARRRAARAEH